MNQSEHADGKDKKRRPWRFWIVVFLNLAGVVVAIPLLVVVFPLLEIWWDTHSQENFTRHQAASRPRPAAQSAPAKANPPATPQVDSAKGTLSALAGLTNNLNLVGALNREELDKIVATQFGKQKPTQADPGTFDSDSSVFDKITRSTAIVKGKEYYCYEVDLVDQNGNHKIHTDCFEKPDLDYERSMAALELVNSNPQLKKIYKAFSHVLAEKSSPSEDRSGVATTVKPAIRIEKDGVEAEGP